MAKKDIEPLIWHTEQRKVDELKGYEFNPRQLTEKQLKDLKKSLEKFNLVEIPAIDTDNTLIAGHQRCAILKMLGRGSEIIDVRVPNRKLTEKEFKEYNIRSNKNTGEWDFDVLANAFEVNDLMDWGFESWELGGVGENIEKINELQEWKDAGLEFNEGEKDFKLTFFFKDEESREKYCNDNAITEIHKMNNQWSVRV